MTSSASAAVTFLNTWGGHGSGNGQFDSPYDVVVSGTGQIYVADTFNDRIQGFDVTGEYQMQWNSLRSDEDQFSWPAGVAVSRMEQVYVGDYNNHRIQRFDAIGTYQTEWAETVAVMAGLDYQ